MLLKIWTVLSSIGDSICNFCMPPNVFQIHCLLKKTKCSPGLRLLFSVTYYTFVLLGNLQGSALVDQLQEQENVLKQCVEQLENAETTRAALVFHLKEALQDQVQFLTFIIFSLFFICFLYLNKEYIVIFYLSFSFRNVLKIISPCLIFSQFGWLLM